MDKETNLKAQILRDALKTIYGDGYITKFSNNIGRRRQTVHRWLKGDSPIPKWAFKMATLMMREKKRDG